MAPRQRVAAAASAAAAACMLAVSAMLLLAAAPAAADRADPEQPGPDYLAFLERQKQAVLAEFAKQGAIPQAGSIGNVSASGDAAASVFGRRRQLLHQHGSLFGSSQRSFGRGLQQEEPEGMAFGDMAALSPTGDKPAGAGTLPQRTTCAHAEDAEVTAAATAALEARVAELLDARLAAPTATINTYFHLISPDGSFYATDAMIQNQINLLNSVFAPTNFEFVLSGVSKTTNASWYPLDIFFPNKGDMQTATRKGTGADLNIWVTMLNNGGIVGVASNPWGGGVGFVPFDGVVIELGTLPGAWYAGYNGGMNAVHETGHWLGLSHPWLGGCSESNDGCNDTPQMAASNYNCYPKGSAFPNSCPNRPADQGNADPVRNYMGYTYDACMDEFSPLQAARMTAAWQQYRQPAFTGTVESVSTATRTTPAPTTPAPTTPAPTTPAPTTPAPTTPAPTTTAPTTPAPTTPEPTTPETTTPETTNPEPTPDPEPTPGSDDDDPGGGQPAGRTPTRRRRWRRRRFRSRVASGNGRIFYRVQRHHGSEMGEQQRGRRRNQRSD